MPRRFQRTAFTLPELVIGLGVTAILMTGMGSAMLLASRAVPNDDEPLKAHLIGYQLIEKIVTELAVAKTIVSQTATTIEFTVEDRDDDLVDETFKYTWAGTPGDPILRNETGTLAWESVATNVFDFEIEYDIRKDDVGIDRLYTVNFHMQLGNNPNSHIEYGMHLLNTPQVTP